MLDYEGLRNSLWNGLDLTTFKENPLPSLKALLDYAYITKGLSLYEISKLTKGEASHTVIKKLLQSYGIKLRKRGGKHERSITTNA